jgi:preprotein translocase subunit SecY
MRVLRATTYCLALLVASTAALLAFVASSLPDATRTALAAFGLVIAAVMVLWVHQPISRMSVSSAILLILAFTAPSFLVHETFNTALCRGSTTPCTPTPNSHLGLSLGLAAVLLSAALITAAVGRFRSSRLTSTPIPRRRSLA